MSDLRSLMEIYPADQRASVPLGLRVNEVVVGQGITGADPITGAMPQDAEAQMRAALDLVRQLVERAGGSLSNLARVTAFVNGPDDRPKVYKVWEEAFPPKGDPNRPAFKVSTIPLPRGVRVRLDALAVLGGERRRIDIEGVSAHDPTITIGRMMLTSRLHGSSPGAALPDTTEKQIAQGIANARQLMEIAGGKFEDLSQLTAIVAAKDDILAGVKAVEAAYHDRPVQPATSAIVSHITPGHGITGMVEATASIAGKAGPGERFQEYFSKHGEVPLGARIGPVLFAANVQPHRLTVTDPVEALIEAQYRSVLARIDQLLAAGGAAWRQVARVNFYLSIPALARRNILNAVWGERFPNPHARPPHRYVGGPTLPEGVHVSAQLIALPQEAALPRILHVPGLTHMDPMTMGVRLGSLVATARVFPGSPSDPTDADGRIKVMLGHAKTLMEGAGGSLNDVMQGVFFVGPGIEHGPFSEAARRAWDRSFTGPRKPDLVVLNHDLSGTGQLRPPGFSVWGLIGRGAS